MKWFILILYSVNIYPASLLDQSVRNLQQLNADGRDEVLSMCINDQTSSNCKNTNNFDAKIAANYLKCANNEEFTNEKFDKFLDLDTTDKFPYILDAKSPDWYVCQHFSTQTFMRGSCFANTTDNQDYEKRTPIKINEGLTEQSNKLPIFYVSIASKSSKLYHAINAIFIGKTAEDMVNIDNYILFEPQSDKKYFSVDELRQDWKSYNLDKADDLKLRISVMDTPGSVSNGDLQFRTKEVVSFDCSI
jgi:hypothetical protein